MIGNPQVTHGCEFEDDLWAWPYPQKCFHWHGRRQLQSEFFCFVFFFFYQFSSFLPMKADFLATKSQVWWQKSLLVIVTPISPRCLMCLLEKPQKTCLPVHSRCQINIWWISEMCFSMRWYIQKIAMYSFYIEKKKKVHEITGKASCLLSSLLQYFKACYFIIIFFFPK